MKIRRNTNYPAFTLIEMLVVIAVIILVAALLFPALLKSWEKAQNASRKNYQRRIGIELITTNPPLKVFKAQKAK